MPNNKRKAKKRTEAPYAVPTDGAKPWSAGDSSTTRPPPEVPMAASYLCTRSSRLYCFKMAPELFYGLSSQERYRATTIVMKTLLTALCHTGHLKATAPDDPNIPVMAMSMTDAQMTRRTTSFERYTRLMPGVPVWENKEVVTKIYYKTWRAFLFGAAGLPVPPSDYVFNEA